MVRGGIELQLRERAPYPPMKLPRSGIVSFSQVEINLLSKRGLNYDTRKA